MRIALGSDHAGLALKTQLAEHLRGLGHEVLDLGTSSDEAVDYPRFAFAVAEAVRSGACPRGIMIDGAGIGSCMAANKVPGVRAALAYDLSSARNSREHNDANVLTLGAGLIGPVLARQIVDVWLATDCVAERHLGRVALIGEIERGAMAALSPGPAPGDGAPPPGLAPGGDAPRPGPAPGDSQPLDLTPEDLERIALHLERLLAGSQAGAPTALGGSRGPSISSCPDTARRFISLGVGRLSADPEPPGPIPEDIAGFIDHTLLKPDATAEEVRRLCADARRCRFAAVCVNPIWIKLAAGELKGTDVAVCSVVGFPLGATPPAVKAHETRQAIRQGAREIDMVIQLGALKGGDDDLVLEDIRAVVEACRDGGAICKVIIEAALLTDEEKRRACRLARRARAHFVKTSTGFGPGGATAHDVALMAEEVRGAGMEVKAAGGIRSLTDAQRMLEAGATRIGASASLAIMEEARIAAGSAPEESARAGAAAAAAPQGGSRRG